MPRGRNELLRSCEQRRSTTNPRTDLINVADIDRQVHFVQLVRAIALNKKAIILTSGRVEPPNNCKASAAGD